MSDFTPVMDENGDIVLHGRSDLDLPISFKLHDEQANQMVEEDCSTAKLFLEVTPGGVRRELALDPDNAKGRRMQLTTADVTRIKKTGAASIEYCVRDETGNFAFVRLDGKIKIRGFAK